MRIAKISSIAMAIVIAAAALSASRNEIPNAHSPLLARLLYRGGGDLMPHETVCMSIWREGQYRIFRNEQPGRSRLLQGTMSDEELKQLKSMLETTDFHDLSSARGDLVREEFIAEVRHEKGAQHVVLVIPDRNQAFPRAASEVIRWLLNFKPQNAEMLTNTDSHDVCPLPNVSPYVPVATNR